MLTAVLDDRHSPVVDDSLCEDLAAALAEMVTTVEDVPGQFKPEFHLEYWSGVKPPAEAWGCTVEGDIVGDDGGSRFRVMSTTAADALRQASTEAWRRVRPSPSSSACVPVSAAEPWARRAVRQCAGHAPTIRPDRRQRNGATWEDNPETSAPHGGHSGAGARSAQPLPSYDDMAVEGLTDEERNAFEHALADR